VTSEPPAPPSLTTQAIWLMVAKTIGFVLAIALPLLLVRRLSQSDLGLYKQAFFVVTTAMNALPLGFGLSAFYFLPREPERQRAVIANIVAFYAVSGICLAALLLIWPGVLARLFNSAELTGLARPIALVVVLWTVGSLLELVTVALQDVRASTSFIVLMQMSKTALLVAAATTIGTVGSLLAAALLQGVVQIAAMTIYLQRRFPGFWHAVDWGLLRRQAAYAVPIGLSSLVIQLQDSLHHLFVSNAYGPVGYAIYSVGVFQLPLVGILRESAGAVMLPRINQLESQNKRLEILQLVAGAARKLALVYFPLCAFLLVAGREVVILLFTRQYVESWPIFAISILVLPLNAIVLDPVTRAHSQRFFFLRLRLAILAALTLLLWTSARELGLVGIIAAVVAAPILIWIVGVVRMVRLLEVGPSELRLFGHVGWIAASTAGAAAAAALARASQAHRPEWLIVGVAAVAFAAVYAAGLRATGVIAGSEIAGLWLDVKRMLGRLPAPQWLRRRQPHAPPDPTAPAL
jgi:O-antigen/teichoic acid export membrane protein